MNLSKEKASLNAELHRCAIYLKDRETELPEHLKQTDSTVLSTQARMKEMHARLSEIAAEEAEYKAEQQKLDKASALKLEKFKGKLFKLREEINKTLPTLRAREKNYFFELQNILNQKLVNYKPKDK